LDSTVHLLAEVEVEPISQAAALVDQEAADLVELVPHKLDLTPT
jgi:hypothetical protein